MTYARRHHHRKPGTADIIDINIIIRYIHLQLIRSITNVYVCLTVLLRHAHITLCATSFMYRLL